MASTPVLKMRKSTADSFPYCQECRILKQAFVEAVREVMVLNQLHLTAVMDDEVNPHRFDILIHEANEQKQNAKYAYILHLETHGGSPQACNYRKQSVKELLMVS